MAGGLDDLVDWTSGGGGGGEGGDGGGEYVHETTGERYAPPWHVVSFSDMELADASRKRSVAVPPCRPTTSAEAAGETSVALSTAQLPPKSIATNKSDLHGSDLLTPKTALKLASGWRPPVCVAA